MNDKFLWNWEKHQKRAWLEQYSPFAKSLRDFDLSDVMVQKKFDDFIENAVANFPVPYGIAPNFVINGKKLIVPMVTEESSVVAAASKAAKFWSTRGGFKARVLGMTKRGQVHFLFTGDKAVLEDFFQKNKSTYVTICLRLLSRMKERGGGFIELKLLNKEHKIPHYFQLELEVDTVDAMGANLINTILEELGEQLKKDFSSSGNLEVIMCILSNYTPECVVEAHVELPVHELSFTPHMTPDEFAKRFCLALQIASVDLSRAVTHNKGIMNGVDAVVMATGNDTRAVEASAHAFACRSGEYSSLSSAEIDEQGIFHFRLKLPLALGTVGGLTKLHPLAKMSLELLGNPDARQLMEVAACVGLAQNFAAVSSLITTGIQRGHMKMHLMNILCQLEATEQQIDLAKQYFADKVVSYYAVEDFLHATGRRH
jgi:hydroxymethylglutaryl-CoA reductase